MNQRTVWNAHLAWVVLGLVLGQSVTHEGATFAASASPSGGPETKQTVVSLAGKVVDPDGRPIAQAKVTLTIMKWSEADASMKTQSQHESVTGPDGAFSFKVDKPEPSGSWWSVITADKPGSAWGWSSWGPGDKPEDMQIRLTAPKSLAGVVVDEAGKPIADVQVTLAQAMVPGGERGRSFGGEVGDRLFNAVTDSSGRFRLERLPADASVDLLVRKQGRATVNSSDLRTMWTGTLTYAAGREDIQIQLPPEARVEGTVVEQATGKPVPGIRVEVAGREGNRVTAGRALPAKEDGTFVFPGLPAGPYTVRTVRDQVKDWAPCSQEVALSAGKTTAVRMELIKGGLLQVTVKEDPSGRPVDKVYVSIRDETKNEWVSGQTDANGVARIHLLPGDYQINAVNGGDYASLNPNQKVSIEDGKTASYEYHVTRLPKVQGVVLDPNGRPLEGVSVQVFPETRGDMTSDSQGRFELRWDPTSWGERIQCCVVARHERLDLAAGRDLDETTGRLELKLEPGLALTGRVVDPNNRPLATAQINVLLRSARWGAPVGRDRQVGADGRFSASALPPGYAYEVIARAEGFGQVRRQVTQDDAVSGPKDLGDLQLALANLSITGIVVDVNDAPVADARISTYGEGQPDRYDIRSDAQGRFTVQGVCAGPIQVSASVRGPQQVYGSARTEGGAKDVKIALGRSASSRPMPTRVPSLKGRPLPDLKTLGVTAPEASDKPLLVCLLDIEQRPSRRCLSDLARQSEAFAAKGVSVVVVQVSKADLKQYDDWIKTNNVAFTIHVAEGSFEGKKAQWGAKALPWLILTDQSHKVVADGFAVSELDGLLAK